MSIPEDDFNDSLEAAYWQFDARVKGYGEWKGRPQSERDAFKATVRGISAILTRRTFKAPMEEIARACDTAELLLRESYPGEAASLKDKVRAAKSFLASH